MATSKFAVLALLFLCAASWSRESTTPASCQAATDRPAIATAKAALDSNTADLPARFALADALSDAGCFNEAVQVLQSAPEQHPINKELETRLRVAKSLVGEQQYFENVDRADAEARFKRDAFRCSSLSDVDACSEAVRMKPEDPTVLIAQADALVRAKRPADAIAGYRRAAVLVPDQAQLAMKISAAETQLRMMEPDATMAHEQGTTAQAVEGDTGVAAPRMREARAYAGKTAVRRYSNAEPATRSH